MYTLIQQFADTGEQSWPDPDTGALLPLPSVVEDERGARLLLCGELVPEIACRPVETGEAEALLRVSAHGAYYAPRAQFLRHRRINTFVLGYELGAEHWLPVHPGTAVAMRLHAESVGKFVEVGNDFVHVHTHTEFSPFDGYSLVPEVMKAVVADGQRAVAITDHGGCFGHPAFQAGAKDAGVKPIFGEEFYFTPDRHSREQANGEWDHLVLWAMDDEGLRNLYALSTESYREGEHYKPRIDWDSLARLNKGVMASTACLGGPLLGPYGRGEEELALSNLARLGDLFGDRLYIEMHANHLPEQIAGNKWLARVAKAYNVPMLAAVDSHYATPADREPHQNWIKMQTSGEPGELFGGNQAYHLMTAVEVRSALGYLGEDVVEEAVANTGRLAERCDAEIRAKHAMPRYSRPTPEHPDVAKHDAERMVDVCLANWDARITNHVPVEEQGPYFEAFEYQAKLLIEKGFPGYFLTTWDLIAWAKERMLVGPGRGSGAASLVAYLMRITEIDPIEAELLHDRFMTLGRRSLPDFDLDFPTSRGPMVAARAAERWGENHVVRVGSHMRIKNKSAFKDVQRALQDRLPGESYALVETICKLIDAAESSTAGLGLSWDDLFAQIGEVLEPFREKIPEVFALAEAFRGRLKTYGKHAAGFLIDADSDLMTELPMRSGAPGEAMVTQWDMAALEPLGYVKWDFLQLRNLDTLQETIDLVEARTGDKIDVYGWTEEYNDPEVYAELSAGWTLGVFQIETSLGTRTTKEVKPVNRDELTAVITLGRPGPMRSGLDKLYMRRRAGEEAVSYPDPRLEKVLSKTFGAMLYQEDIMAVCIELAAYDSDGADDVRKILGKKQVEKADAEGRRFVERAVANQTDKQVAIDIWAQMAEFAKYSFNKSHAYAYATLGFWTAWFKVHYPSESLTASMITIDKDRIPQFVAEARRLGYKVLPPDINISKDGFTSHELEIRYGFQSVPGIGAVAALALQASQPYASYSDFLERRDTKANMGVVKKLVRIGAFDSLHPHRRALETQVMADDSGLSAKCRHMDRTVNNHNLPCVFDWASLPVVLGKTGKPLKNQPGPPKKCTKACKQYDPPPPPDYEAQVQPYTEAEVREIEHEMLGVFLSSSPFDVIPQEVMADLVTGEDLVAAETGSYLLVGIVASARPDPKGRDFGFVTFNTPAGDVSTIVFSNQWKAMTSASQLRKGAMMLFEVLKSDQDRYRLLGIEPL